MTASDARLADATASGAAGTRLERALGITDRPGWLTAVWQSLVVGAVFVAVSLAGSHAPRPRGVAVAVTGQPAATRALESAVAAHDRGAFRFVGVADGQRGLQRLRRGDVYAVLDLGEQPRLDYAGANGPTVTVALTTALLPAAAQVAGAAPVVRDDLPMAADDAAGLPLFYLAFAVVLSSYLFAITTTTRAPRLGPWGHWTSALALAVLLSAAATLLARYATHTLTAHAPTVGLVLALASLATGAATFALLRASATVGSVLGTIVLVVLASASGGVVPGEFLPGWLSVLRPVLPMGVALTGVRDVVYFGGHRLAQSLLVLLAWAVLPLLAVRVLGRPGRGRTAGVPAGPGPGEAVP